MISIPIIGQKTSRLREKGIVLGLGVLALLGFLWQAPAFSFPPALKSYATFSLRLVVKILSVRAQLAYYVLTFVQCDYWYTKGQLI